MTQSSFPHSQLQSLCVALPPRLQALCPKCVQSYPNRRWCRLPSLTAISPAFSAQTFDAKVPLAFHSRPACLPTLILSETRRSGSMPQRGEKLQISTQLVVSNEVSGVTGSVVVRSSLIISMFLSLSSSSLSMSLCLLCLSLTLSRSRSLLLSLSISLSLSLTLCFLVLVVPGD